MVKHMRNCQEVSKLISLSQEKTLTFMERAELKYHLFMCKNCQYFNDNMNNLSTALKRFRDRKDN